MACAALPRAASAQAEGSFERTLKVTGPVDLTIRSGSGRIRVYAGAGDSVRVSARLRGDSSWFSSDVSDRIRRIEKNPPIEQNGNAIILGRLADEDLLRHISISYDVAVPAQTTVNARTGSGSVDIGDLHDAVTADSGSGSITIGRIAGAVVAGTGSGSITVTGAASLKASSGSGSIEAAAIGGASTVKTGSGSIRLALTGKGDVDVSASSGDVVLSGVDGAAHVSAASGSIRVDGRPAGPWSVHSSSGSVTLRLPNDAAFDLDARTSSGGVESAHPITVSGLIDRHRLHGKVRGGGVLVTVSSSSGGIHIQ
jgi:DUF4097 and DUF4098 domain-containing protein YvlB